MSAIDIRFLELREPGMNGTFGKADVPPVAPVIRRAFGGALVLNSDYDQAGAETAWRTGAADAIAFGRPFIANPDLPHRFATAAPLAADVMVTWYSQAPQGYTDYAIATAPGHRR